MPEDSPQKVYMMNALWFKPKGGAVRYQDYLRAAGPIVAKYGGRALGRYRPLQAMIGKFDAELVFFVEWPSWEMFEKFVADPEYAAIRHLREEAITKSLLIRCEAIK